MDAKQADEIIAEMQRRILNREPGMGVVPEDDGEPVTKEWLVNVAGFDPDDFGPMRSLPEDDRPPRPLDQGVIHIRIIDGDAEAVFVNESGDCSWFAIPVPTRGHVRRLLAALSLAPEAGPTAEPTCPWDQPLTDRCPKHGGTLGQCPVNAMNSGIEFDKEAGP